MEAEAVAMVLKLYILYLLSASATNQHSHRTDTHKLSAAAHFPALNSALTPPLFPVPPNPGKFKEQATSNSAWLPVLNSKVPEPRPGTCHNDTATLPDSVLNFIRKHPLMDKAVDHEFGNPVFFKRDVILTKLVVDK